MADLTPTILQNVRLKIKDIWDKSKNTKPDLRNSPITLQGLLENQTATVSEQLQSKGQGGKCVPREVMYMAPEAQTLPTVSATDIAGTCDIAAGEGVDTFLQEYDTNIHIEDTLTIDDDLCNNEYTLDELLARGLASKMSRFSDAINRHVIGILNANAQTITPGNEASGTIGAGLNTIEWAASRFRTDANGDILTEWEQVAVSEGMPMDFLVMDGKNLNIQINHSQYQRFSDDDRTTYARYTDGMHDIYRDIRVLEAVTGDKATFLVDQHSYAFYANKLYGDTMMEQKGHDGVTQVFSLPLSYVDYFGQIKDLEYNTMNGTEKAYVNIEYQLVCSGTSTKKGRTYAHRFRITFAGMFDLAPAIADAAGDTKVGIIKMVQV